MIIDRINNLHKYSWFNPGISRLTYFIESHDMESIQEKQNFENLSFLPISSKEVSSEFNEQLLEAHRKFHDIHITLSGIDVICFSDLETDTKSYKTYDDANDYLLVTSGNINKIYLPRDYFCIISPHTAHMALYKGHNEVKKLVIKIPV